LGCGQQTPVRQVPAREPAESSAAPAAPSPPVSAAVPARQVREAPCGTSSCDYRTEICCETDRGRLMTGCQKRLPPAEAAAFGQKCYGEFSADWLGIGCLSSQDCEAGTKCCAFGELTYCGASCEEHEACVPGQPETCHAGSRCEAAGYRSGGACFVASPSTACGKTRCGGDEAGCRYDWKKQRGECFALGPHRSWPESALSSLSDAIALMQCASPKDCAGERCCAGGPLPMTECSGQCMSGIDVCDTIADCPVFVGPPTGCDADPLGPPFLKTCRYAASEN
jgi:hypothetical protein